MTRRTLFIFGLLLAGVIVVLLLDQGGVISLRQMVAGGEGGASRPGAGDGVGKNPEPVTAEPGSAGQDWAVPREELKATVSFEYIRRLLANAEANQRRTVLADKEKFRQFIEQEARGRSLLAAARANNLHEDPDIRFVMQRAAENVLKQVYLNRLISNQLPADFPSDAQVRDYYEEHRDRFRLGDRLHVWQVYLPFSEGSDESAKEKVTEKARGIAADIRSGQVSFSQAAREYSAHAPSRNNGGYLGLVKVDELRPELADAILDLKEGRVSDPIVTPEGVHIIRKGETVAGREVALDEVRDQVRQILLNQARGRLRQAIYDKAADTYPVALKQNRIEEWRLRLRTDTAGEKTGQTP